MTIIRDSILSLFLFIYRIGFWSLILFLIGLILIFIYDLKTFKPFVPNVNKSKSLGRKKWNYQTEKIADFVLIGSGMGSLQCGAVLSQMGFKVIILEQHEIAGGGAHEFFIDGRIKWSFPSGLHYTIGIAEQILQSACGSVNPPVKVKNMGNDKGVYDRIKLVGSNQEILDIVDDKKLHKDLIQRFPQYVKEINLYFWNAKKVMFMFPFWMASALLSPKIRSYFLNSFLMSTWKKLAGQSAESVLRNIIKDDSKEANYLRSYLAGLWIDTGCLPSKQSFFMNAATTVGFSLFGGSYPDGGSQAIVMSLVEAIEYYGSKVYVNAGVTNIMTDNDDRAIGVELDDGSRIFVRMGVVSGCGYENTKNLLEPRLIKKYNMDEPLHVPHGESFVMCNIGFNGKPEELGIECNNIWLQPASDRINGDMIKGVDEYFQNPLEMDHDAVPMMITFPSVKNREHHHKQPDGTITCQILCPAPWDLFEKYLGSYDYANCVSVHDVRKYADEYHELKNKWETICLDSLFTFYPQLKNNMVFANISTPLTINKYLRGIRGTAIGLDVTPKRFVDSETLERLNMSTPISNLYLTGQDILICGQPIAQIAGILTAIKVMGGVSSFLSLQFMIRSIRLLSKRIIYRYLLKWEK